MATIKFRRGSGQPTGLTAYEPAWDTTNNRFFINNGATALWVGAKIENDTSLGGAGASAFVLPTQLSVKTYVDNQVAGGAVTSVDGVTGAVDLLAGSGIQITLPTGTNKGITLTNIGVLSIDGATGAITNVARTNTTNSFSSLQTFTSGISVTSGMTLSDILRVRGSLVDPGGRIELWDENNTFKVNLQTEATTAKNSTFEFGGADGFVVAANTDGATSGWVVKAAGAGLSPTWVEPSDATTGITSFKSLRSDKLFTQATTASTYQVALSGGKTGYQDYYTEDALTWNASTQVFTVSNLNVTGGITAPNSVNRILAGTGIQVSGPTGNVTITNIGVQSLSGTANQITVGTGTTGALTVSLPSAITTPGSLTVTGNLVVNGTTTTVNSTTVTVQDPIINIGGYTGGIAPGVTGDVKDRGIAFQYNSGVTSATGYFGYDQSKQRFIFIQGGADITNEVVTGNAGSAEFSGVVAPQGTLTLIGQCGSNSSILVNGAATSPLTTINYISAEHIFSGNGISGGVISLASDPVTVGSKASIYPATTTFAGTRNFTLPDWSGGLVAATTSGGTSDWLIRGTGTSTAPTWINPNAQGFTAFRANGAVTSFIQGFKSGGTFGLVFASGTGYANLYTDSSNDISWNPTTITLTIGNGLGRVEAIVDGGAFV